MNHRRNYEVVCHRCGFPARRGALPILWPSDEVDGAAAFCSVHCLEATLGKQLPEPMRSLHLAVEGAS